MINYISSQRGQGLLEAVFAIGILLIVAGAILALSTSNVLGQKSSEFQVRANNLSREGIEVVRSIRDANWLAGNQWDAGIGAGVTSKFARAMFDSTDSSWVLDFAPDPDQKILWLDLSTGVHSHETSGAQRTVFSRVLELSSICLDSSTGAETIEDTCQGALEKIGIEIVSIVSWDERGRDKEIRLVSLLYAWK